MKNIYTIGYEGTDIERFVLTLVNVGIDLIADVRAVPISRKRGFSKNILAEKLRQHDIDYIHFKALGDPKPGRDAAKAGNFSEFRRIYKAHLSTKEAQADLKRVAAVAAVKNVCLLCFEREPEACHRSLVAANIEQFSLKQFDLFGDLPRRYDSFQTSRRYFSEGLAAAE